MPLDEKFLSEAKSRLMEEQKRIQEGLERFAKPTDAPGDYETTFNNIGTDEDENASEVEEYADNLALENNLEGQLKDIKEALEKIDNGSYGYCAKCQQEIGKDRLLAYPAAKTCLNCK